MGHAALLRVLLTFAALASMGVGVESASASTARCPAPATCRAYVLDSYRWPAKAGAAVSIPYYVNNAEDQWLSTPQFVGAVKAAADVWMRANPRIRLVYKGSTTALPGIVDGLNVVGFGPPLLANEEAHAAIQETGGIITEEDMSIALNRTWTWMPCPQRNGGCSGNVRPIATVPAVGEDVLTVRYEEIQGVIEHEFGHWLSLDHPPLPDGTSMTMNGTYGADGSELHYQTLGLGDLLGVRAAYPCIRKCPPVTVYSP